MKALARVLARSLDRLHARSDAAALAAGWSITRTRFGGRSYGWTRTPVPGGGAGVVGPEGAVVVDLTAHRSRTTGPASGSTAPTLGGAA